MRRLVCDDNSGQVVLKRRKQRRSKKRRRWCPLFYVPLVIIFTCMSALLFKAFEFDESHRVIDLHNKQCSDLYDNIVYELELLSNTTLTNDDVKDILSRVDTLTKCHSDRVPKPHEMSFINGMSFAASVYTTLGYGQIASDLGFSVVPITLRCRVLTALVAVTGIPLYISFTSDLAESLSDLIFTCLRRIRRLLGLLPSHKLSKTLIFLTLTALTIVYLLLASALVMAAERCNGREWDYNDSVYFMFSSISLIGFGDLNASHNLFVFCHLPLIIVGQTLLAMVFYMITKFVRFVLPRQFSVCCLATLNILSPESTQTRTTETSEEPRLGVNSGMCLQMDMDQEVSVSDEDTQDNVPLMAGLKRTIGNVLPWSQESAPIETSSRTLSPFTPYNQK